METMTSNIDLNYLRSISGDSIDFELNMLEIFVTQTNKAIESIRKSIDMKNWDRLSVTIHKMKPSFFFIGNSKLTDKAIELEKLTDKHGDFNEIERLSSVFIKLCKEAIEDAKMEIEKHAISASC